MMYVSLLFAGNTYYQPNVTVLASPVGAGSVYVSITSGDKTSQSADGKYGAKNNKDAQTTFYFYVDHTNNDYLWYRWENQKGTEVNKNKNHSLSLAYSSGSTHGGTTSSYKITETQNDQSGESDVMTYTMPFTAKWVQPDVTGVTNGTANGTRQSTYDLGTVTNPTATTNNVAFILSNDYAGLLDKNDVCPDYYSVATPLASNGYTNGNISHTKGSGSLTVPVIYTPTGIHGQTNSASLTVKSNYPSAGTNCWTAALTIAENYKPIFTLDATSYNFTPTQPILNNASGTYTLLISGRNYAASNIAKWDVSWGTVTYEGGTYPNANPYSLDFTDVNNPKVIFTAPATGTYKDVTAKLTITAKYKDANGTLIASEPKIITFSADAGEQLTINDEREYTMDFGVIDFGKAYTDEVMLISTYTDLDESVANPVTGITFNTDVANEKVVVSIANTTAIGDHASSLTLSKGALSVVLNVKAQVKLAKPVVTTTNGLGQQLNLSWQPVLGATSYIVEGKRVVDADFTQLVTIGDDEPIETSYVVNNIGGVILTTGTEYTFRVMAVYGPDEFANRFSNEVTVIPSAQGSITASSTVELYTGTEIFVEGNATYGVFPYRKKRAINLDAAFSPSGAPLFDKLYIFGMTTSEVIVTVSGQKGHKITPASNTKGSDAITPCYVYAKNGNQYDLQQTIPNMNVANKPIADISGATSVYLTGYCPYASTGGGNNKDENGVVCFTGGAGVNTHVYIDDLQLYARYKSNDGNTSKPDTVLFSGLQTEFRCVGTSTAFAFKGTSSDSGNPFQPTIHMRDSNRLSGNTGSAVKVDIKVNIPLVGEKGMTQTAGQYNSPIGLLTDEDKRYTTLSIDDVWPASMADNASGDVRTNGFLDIRTTTAAPCIDLYDKNGKVNFNGGRIYLKNSRPSGSNNYLCTFSVGYRMYSKTVEIASIPITATMYGLGTDQSGGEVNFNDGSFYIDPLTDTEFTKHGKYYHHKHALKCPSSTTINGGTYYCEPFSCTESENLGASPLNKYGDGLVLDTVAVESLLEPYKTAVINFPNDKEVQAEYAATYPATLGEYYTAKGGTYGISSLNAYQGTQAPDSVILMLPVQYTDKALQKEVVNVPWALCIPDVLAGGSIAIGGNTEVADKEEDNVIYQTNYLLYGTIDEYVVGVIDAYKTPEFDGLPAAEVELTGGTYSNILNEEPYTIQQEQYMMMSVKADEWFLFAPPFDISAVYVLETAVETELETMAKNEGWQAAINKQAAANMDLFYALCYLIDYTESVNNFDGVFYSWKTELKPAGAGGQVKLTHFTGSNWDKANYYVQRSSGTWEWDAEKSRFVTDWEYLPKTMEKVTHGDTEYSVVMKKGEIYSLNFPYMYNGYREKGDGNGNNNWDYWTGKYILFVGKGPQTIEGKNHHNTITASMPATPGTAEIRANSTFASMDVSGMEEYGLVGQQFIPNTSGEPLPVDATQGFVLLNKPTASPMPQRIKTVDMMSGDVTLEGGEGTVTGTPTIAGGNSLVVYNIDGGMAIVPVSPQQVALYNAAGQLIMNQYLTDEVRVLLPNGIYFVRGESQQTKAMVK